MQMIMLMIMNDHVYKPDTKYTDINPQKNNNNTHYCYKNTKDTSLFLNVLSKKNILGSCVWHISSMTVLYALAGESP